MTCMVSFRPNSGTRPVFLIFRCPNEFIKQEVYFSRLMRVCVGLIKSLARRVLSPDFPAFNWSSGFGIFLPVSALASHWLEDCANFTPTPEENDQYSANHSWCNTSTKSIHFLSMHNSTPLVIRTTKISS
jgi:hypothetical protein